MEAQLLEKGIMGLVILAQMWAIKRLYTDLESSRQNALDTLERVSNKLYAKQKSESTDNLGDS